MVVLGTRPEYFSAVWVRNEWSRFLALIKNGEQKVLIPAYRDMSPYDLPEEFSHLQALDMSRLGFMQDLIRGIKKILGTENISGTANAATSPLLRRAFLFLEDKDWRSAAEYSEKILDQEPENARAYLCKLMAELQVSKPEDLRKHRAALQKNSAYRRAVQYADATLKAELESYAAAPEPKKPKQEKTAKPKPGKKPEAQTKSRLKKQLPMVAAVLALVVLAAVGIATSKKEAAVPDEPPASLSTPVSEPQEMAEEVTAQDTEPETQEPIAPEEDETESDTKEVLEEPDAVEEETVEKAVEKTSVQTQEEVPTAVKEKEEPKPEQPKQETPAEQPEQPEQPAPAEEKTAPQPTRIDNDNGGYCINEYDAAGRVIKTTRYDANNKYLGDTVSVYDDANSIEKVYTQNENHKTYWIAIRENGHLMKAYVGENENSGTYKIYEYDENWVLQRRYDYDNNRLVWIGYWVDGKLDHEEYV